MGVKAKEATFVASTLHRFRELPRRRSWLLLPIVLGTVVSGRAAAAGPLDDYLRNCGGLTYSEDACVSLTARLMGTEWPTREERLALAGARDILRSIRDPDGYTEQAYCEDVRTILVDHPDFSAALHEHAMCVPDDEQTIALLRRAVDLDAGNYRSLSFLVGIAKQTGEDFGIDAEAFEVYRAALYQASRQLVEGRLEHMRNAPAGAYADQAGGYEPGDMLAEVYL